MSQNGFAVVSPHNGQARTKKTRQAMEVVGTDFESYRGRLVSSLKSHGKLDALKVRGRA